MQQLRNVAVPADLRHWGTRLDAPGGVVPLLGLSVRAAAYPGLLWSGARLQRAGAADLDGLVLVGLVAGAAEASATALARGVAAGRAVSRELASLAERRGAVATPTTGAVGAAVCAAVVLGKPVAGLADVLDFAGALMVVGPSKPGEDDGATDRSLRSGHELAAGWLAALLPEAGLVGMSESLSQTLRTVTGNPVAMPADALVSSTAVPSSYDAASHDPEPPHARVADLLADLL